MDRNPLRTLLETIASKKLNISTLTEVFDSFYKGWSVSKKAAYFIYDNRRWKATIRNEISFYDNTDVNLRILNCQMMDSITLRAVLFQRTNFLRLKNVYIWWRTLLKRLFQVEDLEVKYFEHFQRLVSYIWGPGRTKCITVKFENGYHLGAVDQDVGEYRKLLAIWNTKK